jgi:hypothetical protein
MSTKNALKTMAKSFIEQAVESSEHIKKLIAGMTLIAIETKKVAELMLVLSKRLDEYEMIIFKIIEVQEASKKNSFDSSDLLKSKEKSSKSN